jgi:cell division protein ZapA
MQTLIPINVIIGDRSYRVKIDPKDEEIVRRTLKIINDQIIEYKTQFSGKDMQDYIAMVILWYATQVAASNASATLADGVADTLQKMEEQLDKLL